MQSNQPVLNVSDLQQTVELIDICTQRGAFRAEELSAVGNLYDRLSAFLKFTTQTEEAATEQDPAESAAEVQND